MQWAKIWNWTKRTNKAGSDILWIIAMEVNELFLLVILISLETTVCMSQQYCLWANPAVCYGPFVIEQTSTVCNSEDSVLLTDCITACMKDKCCRAGSIQNGKCLTYFFIPSQTHHFIAHPPKEMEDLDDCLECKNLFSSLYHRLFWLVAHVLRLPVLLFCFV